MGNWPSLRRNRALSLFAVTGGRGNPKHPILHLESRTVVICPKEFPRKSPRSILCTHIKDKAPGSDSFPWSTWACQLQTDFYKTQGNICWEKWKRLPGEPHACSFTFSLGCFQALRRLQSRLGALQGNTLEGAILKGTSDGPSFLKARHFNKA